MPTEIIVDGKIVEKNLAEQGLTQQQIDETINVLRNRVKMHPMRLTELEAWGMDLRTELQRERRVELSFEGQTIFDIFRWKTGAQFLGRAITGPSRDAMINDLGKNPYEDNGVDEFGDIVWVKGDIAIFDPSKHHIWPVPYEERQKNPNLNPNNPGWD